MLQLAQSMYLLGNGICYYHKILRENKDEVGFVKADIIKTLNFIISLQVKIVRYWK